MTTDRDLLLRAREALGRDHHLLMCAIPRCQRCKLLSDLDARLAAPDLAVGRASAPTQCGGSRSSGAWPKVATSWGADLTIYHALPTLGNPARHRHVFHVRFGWLHEINPHFGHSGFPLDKITGMLGKVAALV